jgi:LysM repeat protein
MILQLAPMIKKARNGFSLAVVAFPFILHAAPQRGQQYNTQDSSAAAIREIYSSMEDIRHTVDNHEIEIRMYDEKLKNMDSIIDNVRDQLEEAVKFNKDQLKNNLAGVDAKLVSLDTITKGIANDIQQFKSFSNETTTVLAQYKKKIGEIEKTIDLQNQNIEHLQAAMNSLMEALQGKVPKLGVPEPSSSNRSYKIQQGDSLEKIARNHQISIQSLKDANGLTSDRIVVGKTLIIPEK